YPVNHGTMCAFDVLIAAPKATLLDFPILGSFAPGGSVVGQTLSVALMGFAQLLAFWAVGFAPGGGPRYKALVVSNSWGIYHPSWDFPAGHPGRFIDNPTHPFNVIVGTLARSGADIVFAAGNCGAECADSKCQGRTKETIMGASALPDVLTLAGCDINDARVGYSSQGPSIAGMFQQKPDITAYTHFSGSEAFGAGSPDSGTSAACPVASGCIAALRTKIGVGRVPPASLFASLRSSARPAPGQAGWDGDFGFGIIDPVSVATANGV
ncbi:MAG TPA: S8 family serine peptidase, partial [Bradyrhizobium sp.]|nr:S8 family serine peptidase [Bradyrhizobium sp.]